MIDLRVPGSPPECRDAAAGLRRWAESLTDASRDLRRAEHTSEHGWQGDAADAFRAALRDLRADVGQASGHLGRAAEGLDVFAGALGSVQQAMQQIRSGAIAAGLAVEGPTVQPPVPNLDDSVMRHQARVDAYERLVADAEQLRVREREAHERLQSLLASLRPSLQAWLERLGIHPPDRLRIPGVALWAAGLGAAATGASATGHSVTHARWARGGTVSGVAGGAHPGGTAALGHWEEGGGAWVGAQAGTGAGVATGGVFPVRGTAVGAAVGGAVGGVVGGVAGGMAGGVAGSTVGDRIGHWLAEHLQ